MILLAKRGDDLSRREAALGQGSSASARRHRKCSVGRRVALRPDPGGQPFQVGHSSNLDFRASVELGLEMEHRRCFRLNSGQVLLLQASRIEAPSKFMESYPEIAQISRTRSGKPSETQAAYRDRAQHQRECHCDRSDGVPRCF